MRIPDSKKQTRDDSAFVDLLADLLESTPIRAVIEFLQGDALEELAPEDERSS